MHKAQEAKLAVLVFREWVLDQEEAGIEGKAICVLSAVVKAFGGIVELEVLCQLLLAYSKGPALTGTNDAGSPCDRCGYRPQLPWPSCSWRVLSSMPSSTVPPSTGSFCC